MLADAVLQVSPWPDKPPVPLASVLEASLGKGGIIVVQTCSIQRQWVQFEKLAPRSVAGKLLHNVVEYARWRACEAKAEAYVPSPHRFPPTHNRRADWVAVRFPGYFDQRPYMDFSLGVERPAGKHGFVMVQDGATTGEPPDHVQSPQRLREVSRVVVLKVAQ